MSDEQARLGQLRVDIDRLDQEIMDLISKRAECAQEVARVKMEANPGEMYSSTVRNVKPRF